MEQRLAGKQAQHDSILRRLPSVLQEVQAAASQGTASGSGGGTAASSQAPPQPAQPPDLAAVQAHIMAALETDLLDKIMILVEQWPHQYYGSLTRALVEELAPKGLCLNPAGEYLACAFCRGRAGNPVEFATDAGLKNHYLRQSGASENWPPLRPLTTRAQQARTGARGTGTAGTPDPKDESGTQAPPPRETSVPSPTHHRRALQHQRLR